MAARDGKFEEVKPLDLRKCKSVADIVEGMNQCSFGARMLGEVAATLRQWAGSKNKPVIVYDGAPNTSLGRALGRMVDRRWFSGIMPPEDYARSRARGGNVLVVGRFSERHEEALFKKPGRAIFINQFDLARPGQVCDGYFPDVVFADPAFVMPVLLRSLEEWLEGKPTTVTKLIGELALYGGLGGQVAQAAPTLKAMTEDPRCTVFFTMSGAMTVAQMGLVICHMIDEGMVQSITTTGALLAHGLVQAVGLKHFKHNPAHSDALLARRKINRVTDTLEPESNLDHVEEILGRILDRIDGRQPTSPRILNEMIGRYLAENYPGQPGILGSAYRKRVPVFIPAFFDSEIGNDLYIHNKNREAQGRPRILIDMELDSAHLVQLASSARRAGIFTVGGGVPRNNVQNVAPLIEIMNERLKSNLPDSKFFYGVRISPDKMHYGHLSGSTHEEAKSWRKMDVHGKFNAIYADATQVWPFLIKYLMETRGV